MVVLDPVPNSPATASSDRVKVSVASTDDKSTAAAGYASDGFKTASDTEVTDEDAGTNGNSNQNDSVRQHGEQLQQQLTPMKDHSFDDALNDDELNQKTLAQVNDAKVEGNKFFIDGKYEEALVKYDSALQLAPEMPLFIEVRSICHANRATCFCKLGKYEDAIKESTKALEPNPTYMKALLRRGEAHEKLEHYDEAIADMIKIVELDPSNHQARRTAVHLEPLARAKREKMQEEMIGKLKDMGNSILGRLGMSVDNFKAVQDPNTGSYSISFQR